MRARLVASILLLTSWTGAHAQEATPWREGALALTVLHTNDVHGQVLESSRRTGGLVALGRAIRQERDRARERGDAVLLLDAGDIFKGTPEGDLTDGEVVVAWMNHLGYDALVVGNHEFDHGVEVVARLAGLARFPFLGANVTHGVGGPRPVWLGRAGERSGEDRPDALRGCAVVRTLTSSAGTARVALVGLTTSDMKRVTLKGVTGDLEFEEEAAALERVLAALPPVDLVILITHCGLTADRRLAERFADRIDLIVGGHSHTRIATGERVGSTLIVQTGSRAEALGRVRLESRRVAARVGRPSRLVTAAADLVPAGDDLDALLAPFVEQVRERVDQPVGNLARDLDRRSGYTSSSLGNLHVDLMRAATGADVALHNKTGIRADLPAGVVKVRHLYEVAPFGNTVATVRLKGSDLRDLLLGMLAATSRLLEVSGAVVTCAPDAPEGERLLDLLVGGAPIDPERLYLVATNNFLVTGGDGHVAFTRGTDPQDTGIVLLDLLMQHFRANDPYEPGAVEQRIVVGEPVGAPR